MVAFLVGAFYLAHFLKAIVNALWPFILKKDLQLEFERFGKGSWAVVTGATDGLGKEFAFQLAELGFNIVLTGRDDRKLFRTTTELKSRFPYAQTRTVNFDFAKSRDPREYRSVFMGQLSSIDVSILVNNVGIITYPLFHETPLD